MPFYIAGFVFGRLFAQQRGIVNQSSLNRVALVGGVVGPSPTGLVLTSVVANREAESIPPTLVEVPRVIDLPVDGDEGARKKIEGSGLRVDVLEKLSLVNQGIVIAQDPEPGSRVEPGSTVTLTVNKLGVSVPFVIGFPFDDAKIALSAAALEATRKDENSPLDSGLVFQTDPPRITVVERESTVTVFVSLGPGTGISKRPPAPAR
jgi:beta-lactam-binding protein with PASTA domain